MKHKNTIVMATILAGSIGLAGLGISRAQTASTTSSTVDTATTTTAATTSTTPPHGMMDRGQHLADLATKFGMTTTELQTALDAGTPMYQIAAEHGVTYAKEQTERLAELKTQLDDMVKVGYMTQTEADAVYANAKDNPTVGFGFGGPRSPGPR